MHKRLLKLASPKNELLILMLWPPIHSAHSLPILVNDSPILPAAQNKNLGVIFTVLVSHFTSLSSSNHTDWTFHTCQAASLLRPSA